jgi:lysophospholipase
MRSNQFWVSFVWLTSNFLSVCSSPIYYQQNSPYAPIFSPCPKEERVRRANQTISDAEASYFSRRKAVTDKALEKWLKKIDTSFNAKRLPSIGLTTSGGGFRSQLLGAGVVKAFDSRDGDFGTNGFYQTLTYHVALSGGAWMLGSLAANGWPRMSTLQKELWEQSISVLPSPEAKAIISVDITAKNAMGFIPTLLDGFGLAIGYRLFKSNGGNNVSFSGLTSTPQFESYEVPFPIITAAETMPDQCTPSYDGRQFEIHPYEFGSWDKGVEAFSSTKYLGTNYSNGEPTSIDSPKGCVQNFDNLAYIMAASSDPFTYTCKNLPSVDSFDPIIAEGEVLLSPLHPGNFRDEFTVFPNPFYQYFASPGVESQTELMLVDGALTGQNDPIWPLIQPARKDTIDVLIVNDNTADDDLSWPNGAEIYNTYFRAKEVGLTRMPVIPPSSTFVSEGLSKRATFFGCNSRDTLSIVFLPNVMYSFPSNQSTFRSTYPPEETRQMIANGVKIGTQNEDPQWPKCLACIVMKKAADKLPKDCEQCFEKYCFKD